MQERMPTSAGKFAVVWIATGLISCSNSDGTSEDSNPHFQLTTEFLGENQVLSVQSPDTEAFTFGFEPVSVEDDGQVWVIVPLETDLYRISNREFGESRSLDVINDGVFDQLTLATSGDFSGQMWRITPTEDGYCRLTSEFLGPEMSLDVTSDTESPLLRIRTSGEFSGQNWRLSPLGTDDTALNSLCTGPM